MKKVISIFMAAIIALFQVYALADVLSPDWESYTIEELREAQAAIAVQQYYAVQ